MQNILVIKLGAFGDFIVALGAFEALRKHHKDDKITLMTMPSLAKLARKSGLFDDVIEDTRARTLKHYLHIRQEIKQGAFDFVYDLQCQKRTNRYFKMLWPERPNWNGTAVGCSHPENVPGRGQIHAFDCFKKQLELQGINDVGLPKSDWIDAPIDHFNLPEKFVLIASGCAPHRPQKRWPALSYKELCRRLLDKGITPVLLGTASEADVTAEIACGDDRILDLTAQTNLMEIAGLARRAIGAVGNDTGPMHLIATVGCPSLVLFSNDSCPKLNAPIGPQVVCLQEAHLKDLPVDDVEKALIFRS